MWALRCPPAATGLCWDMEGSAPLRRRWSAAWGGSEKVGGLAPQLVVEPRVLVDDEHLGVRVGEGAHSTPATIHFLWEGPEGPLPCERGRVL